MGGPPTGKESSGCPVSPSDLQELHLRDLGPQAFKQEDSSRAQAGITS